MSGRPAAIGAALIALAVCAWFALGIRQAHDTTAATAIVSGSAHLSAGQGHRAAALLHSAKLLDPDTEVDVLRGELALEQGNRLGARSILERVVAKEPDNALAWQWLAKASVGDLHEFFLAAYRLQQLVPPIPAARHR